MFSIRCYSAKHKIELKRNLIYIFLSGVVSCSEVKVIWGDAWYSSSQQELCMFSQLVGRGMTVVFIIVPTLFLSRCCWILWWDHYPPGTGVPLGSHVMVLLEQERIETLKVCLLWATVQCGTSGSSRTNTQGGP